MDYEALRTVVYKLNEDEQFYKKYYYAKQQEYSLQEFLSTINIDDVTAPASAGSGNQRNHSSTL